MFIAELTNYLQISPCRQFHADVVCIVDIVKVENQLDATKYAVLLPQHVSGTNMPIIRSTISEISRY
jgi:hypothetical protein